jgi:hypothetical protein
MEQVFSFTASNSSAEEAGKEASQKASQFIAARNMENKSFRVLTAKPSMACMGDIIIYAILLVVESEEPITDEERIRQNVEDFVEANQADEARNQAMYSQSIHRQGRGGPTYEELEQAFGPMDD